MMRNPPLPLLPGNDFDRKIGQTRFHKSQHFGNVHKLSMLLDKRLPGIGGAPMPHVPHARWPSIYCRGDVAALPAWLAFDKETLVFDAYFKEALQEVEGSPFLPRYVKIYFYLEDGTIQVQEPRKVNSGIHQGVFISRQRIRFPPDSRSETFVDIVDLNIGYEVELYGRVFKIVNCDRFTRNFLNRMGIMVPDPITMPEDPYMERRFKMQEALQPKRPKKISFDETQFLKYDRCVLRFYGYWDDRESEDGILHKLVLLFYLADDTVEVKEVLPVNSGRTGKTLLARCRLLKEFKSVPTPGEHDAFTVLNVLGQGSRNKRYIFDALNCGARPASFYSQRDLAIGAVINVMGRCVVLCDCDEYTKEHYRANFGLEDFTPKPYPPEDDVVFDSVPRPELPPYNGYGSHEDSSYNCRTIYPVAPVKDLKQFLRKDREGMDSRVLRFSAQMISNIPHLSKRPFIISFYLADDTLTVFENVRVNSGFQGGMFFSRDKFVKPGENLFGSEPPACYSKEDCYIGALLELRDFKFLLTGADEYALRYMELNCSEFPKSNIRQILQKVRERVRPVYKQFVSEQLGVEALRSGRAPYKVLRRALTGLLGGQITEHEVVTVARRFRVQSETPLDCEAIRRLAHVELKRYLFTAFERLLETLRHLDAAHSGRLARKQVYTALRGARVPMDVELTNKVLDCMPQQEEGQINYQDVINFLDYDHFPTAPAEPVSLQHDLSWMSHAPTVDASEVAVDAFLGELGLEEDLRASCGDAAKPCGSAAVVPADAPGLLGAGWGEDGDGPAHRAPGRHTVTFAGLD